MRSPALACASIALLLSTACERHPGDGVTIDTLATGAIHLLSPAGGTWAVSGEEPWRLVEDLRIGVIEGEEPYMFGSARNVFPDAMGRIWVMDSQAYELRVFDGDGVFVRTVGREGDGPGEFGFNPCAFSNPNGEVWVEAGRRWQRFDTAGVLLGGQPTTRSLGCGVMGWAADGRLVAVGSEFDARTRDFVNYYIDHDLDESGNVVPRDTFPAPDLPETPTVSWENAQGRRVITSYIPLVNRATWRLGAGGDLWVVEGDGAYRIRRQTLAGDTLIIMERPYEPVPVPDSARAAEIAGLRREGYSLESGFEYDDIPRVFPAIDRLTIATDQTLWVRRQIEAGAYGLDVFSPDGRFLGPVEAPPEFDRMYINKITSDHMYGVVRDELDVEYVVRLEIRKHGG